MPLSSFGTPCYRSGPALYYEVDHILCDDRNDHALHFHDCYELCFHIRGTQQLYFDQHPIDLQPLDVFIMQPYHIHGLVGPAQLDDHERLVIRLSPSALDRIGQGITSVRTTLDYITKRCGGRLRLERNDWLVIRELLPMIKPDVADQTAVDKLIGLGALRIIVGIVLRASHVLPEAAVDSRRSDALLKSVADYIAANFTGDCTLEKLAERFSISKYHLSHRFADAFGVSLYQYVLLCRIAYAKTLILQGEPLQSVSGRCGFNDYSNFLRVFTRQTGMSPTKWREDALRQIH